MAMFDCLVPVLICVSLSALYVGSLYIWDSSKGRDHPSTIKKRCISVAFMTIISPIFVKYSISQDSFLQYGYPGEGSEFSLLEVMGIRWTGLGNAIIYPLMLTAIFFTGPILLSISHEHSAVYLNPHYWALQLRKPTWLRNQIIAPFSEEWTFRACLLPILLQCMDPFYALFAAPLFFGLAHLHHAVERLRLGIPVMAVIFGTLFQCLFTSLFGMYSVYLFMKTGHFMSAFLTHSFCNLMGLPDVEELLRLPIRKRCFHLAMHVCGIVVWGFSLSSFTENCKFSTVITYLPDSNS